VLPPARILALVHGPHEILVDLIPVNLLLGEIDRAARSSESDQIAQERLRRDFVKLRPIDFLRQTARTAPCHRVITKPPRVSLINSEEILWVFAVLHFNPLFLIRHKIREQVKNLPGSVAKLGLARLHNYVAPIEDRLEPEPTLISAAGVAHHLRDKPLRDLGRRLALHRELIQAIKDQEQAGLTHPPIKRVVRQMAPATDKITDEPFKIARRVMKLVQRNQEHAITARRSTRRKHLRERRFARARPACEDAYRIAWIRSLEPGVELLSEHDHDPPFLPRWIDAFL
jgi:hypothetical protein